MEHNRGVPATARKPEWLKKPLPAASAMVRMDGLLRGHGLHTVCEAAACPNRGECFERRTATFLILGDVCTRDCRFCNIPGGRPQEVDRDEPARVAEAACLLGLSHLVITSVTRDDLPDGGAQQFVATMRAVRRALPEATVEVLVPDFLGSEAALGSVLGELPEVFNHNVETVPRLYERVRPQADFGRSLKVLEQAAKVALPGTGWGTPIPREGPIVKTGFMLGLGEQESEVRELLSTLAGAGVHMVTIGQYLQPSRRHLPVVEYVAPAVFSKYAEYGEALGLVVSAGPFVRSSFKAEAGYRVALERKASRRVDHC